MPLKTTVVGSYPKPDYLKMPDWFTNVQNGETDFQVTTGMYDERRRKQNAEEQNALEQRAVKDVIQEQEELGIDYITDGEVTRENYIYHFLRKLNGIDFCNLTARKYRNGAAEGTLPTIIDTVTPKSETPWVVDEWKANQALAKATVKVTIPGPLTIIDTTYNKAYGDVKNLSLDLVKCINQEVVALAEAGCKYIQIDEPVLVRDPESALNYSIDHLKMCFEGVGQNVMKSIHLCCGYPNYLNQKDYQKADKEAYQKVAQKLDESGFDLISIEDSHRRNDLSLFDKFKKTTIVLGSVAIASSSVETEEEIRDRVVKVLEHIPPERLILAPDCGLGFLPKDILLKKLRNLVTVAKSLP